MAEEGGGMNGASIGGKVPSTLRAFMKPLRGAIVVLLLDEVLTYERVGEVRLAAMKPPMASEKFLCVAVVSSRARVEVEPSRREVWLSSK